MVPHLLPIIASLVPHLLPIIESLVPHVLPIIESLVPHVLPIIASLVPHVLPIIEFHYFMGGVNSEQNYYCDSFTFWSTLINTSNEMKDITML